eukprot:TRINITY_DN1440_c0_g1_i1.p1 TRINITY_DN1440_c0_g1~~TRINITY_DN1440_c0_g1_i1.p1  ORF type:complete len:497 (-),score=125.02 TRINITY_DN1440_c0_g1_i1:584-2074(-)
MRRATASTPSNESASPPAPKRARHESSIADNNGCPYLDTIDRRVLDFDFEKVCSITLQNHNVYGCLVCGKFFQGRAPKSPAYTHSVAVDHHVFINLHSARFYCLPDDYEVVDSSLSDIQYNIAPNYSERDIAQLDSVVIGETEEKALQRLKVQALDDNEYIPGFVGLNNLQQTDWLNAVIQCLNRVKPLRNFFMNPDNYATCQSPLVRTFGELIRKMWNPRNFKSHVSPHELLQAISKESEKKFRIGEQSDPILFLSWLMNTMHRHLSKSKKKKSGKSILSDTFQGTVEVIEEDSMLSGTPPRISEIPFFHLSLKLPNNPLFRDERERDVIPQVPLFALLSKFDGETVEYGTGTRNGVEISIKKRYRIKSLPKYLLIHYARFSKNRFFVEKNPAIVNCPVLDLDMTPYLMSNKSRTEFKYNLVGNIVHETLKKEEVENSASVGMDQMKGSYRTHVLCPKLIPPQWFEIQDLHVKETIPGLVAVSESYVQCWELSEK